MNKAVPATASASTKFAYSVDTFKALAALCGSQWDRCSCSDIVPGLTFAPCSQHKLRASNDVSVLHLLSLITKPRPDAILLNKATPLIAEWKRWWLEIKQSVNHVLIENRATLSDEKDAVSIGLAYNQMMEDEQMVAVILPVILIRTQHADRTSPLQAMQDQLPAADRERLKARMAELDADQRQKLLDLQLDATAAVQLCSQFELRHEGLQYLRAFLSFPVISDWLRKRSQRKLLGANDDDSPQDPGAKPKKDQGDAKDGGGGKNRDGSGDGKDAGGSTGGNKSDGDGDGRSGKQRGDKSSQSEKKKTASGWSLQSVPVVDPLPRLELLRNGDANKATIELIAWPTSPQQSQQTDKQSEQQTKAVQKTFEVPTSWIERMSWRAEREGYFLALLASARSSCGCGMAPQLLATVRPKSRNRNAPSVVDVVGTVTAFVTSADIHSASDLCQFATALLQVRVRVA